jgi:hypothetical protein
VAFGYGVLFVVYVCRPFVNCELFRFAVEATTARTRQNHFDVVHLMCEFFQPSDAGAGHVGHLNAWFRGAGPLGPSTKRTAHGAGRLCFSHPSRPIFRPDAYRPRVPASNRRGESLPSPAFV